MQKENLPQLFAQLGHAQQPGVMKAVERLLDPEATGQVYIVRVSMSTPC